MYSTKGRKLGTVCIYPAASTDCIIFYTLFDEVTEPAILRAIDSIRHGTTRLHTYYLRTAHDPYEAYTACYPYEERPFETLTNQ